MSAKKIIEYKLFKEKSFRVQNANKQQQTISTFQQQHLNQTIDINNMVRLNKKSTKCECLYNVAKIKKPTPKRTEFNNFKKEVKQFINKALTAIRFHGKDLPLRMEALALVQLTNTILTDPDYERKYRVEGKESFTPVEQRLHPSCQTTAPIIDTIDKFIDNFLSANKEPTTKVNNQLANNRSTSTPVEEVQAAINSISNDPQPANNSYEQSCKDATTAQPSNSLTTTDNEAETTSQPQSSCQPNTPTNKPTNQPTNQPDNNLTSTTHNSEHSALTIWQPPPTPNYSPIFSPIIRAHSITPPATPSREIPGSEQPPIRIKLNLKAELLSDNLKAAFKKSIKTATISQPEISPKLVTEDDKKKFAEFLIQLAGTLTDSNNSGKRKREEGSITANEELAIISHQTRSGKLKLKFAKQVKTNGGSLKKTTFDIFLEDAISRHGKEIKIYFEHLEKHVPKSFNPVFQKYESLLKQVL